MNKHILNYAPAKLIPGLINFLGLLIFARIFLKEEYGRYAYVMAILSLVQSLFYPWIRLSLIRFYQKYHKEGNGNKYVHYILFLFILISTLLATGWLFFIFISNSDSSIKFLLFLGLPLMLFNSLFELLMALSRAKLDSKNYAINSILNSFLRLGFVLLLVYLFKFNEVAIFLSLIITNLILVIYYFKKKIDFSYTLLKPNKIYRKEVTRYGIPLTFTFLLVSIISSSDRILIKFFLDSEAVGLYSLPYEFSTYTITNVFMVLNLAYFPVIIKEYENLNFEKVRNRINQYFEMLTLLTLPGMVVIITLAPFITGLFLGENYNTNESIKIIQLITIAGFVSGMKSFYFDLAFHLGNKTNIQIIPVIISGVSNIILNLVLIPLYGVSGAVYATLIAFILGIIFSYYLGRKIIAMPILASSLIKVTVPSAILFFSLTFTIFKEVNWSNFLINILLGGLIYLILVITLNTANMRNIIIRNISRFKLKH